MSIYSHLGIGQGNKSVMDGYNMATTMRNNIAKRKLQEQQLQEQNRIQGELFNLSNDFSMDNANKFLLRNPQYSKAMESTLNRMGEAEKQQIMQDVSRGYSALHNKDYEAAKSQFSEAAKAARDVGDVRKAERLEYMVRQVDENPDRVKTQLYLRGSSIGGDTWNKAIENLQMSPGKIEGQSLDNLKKQADVIKTLGEEESRTLEDAKTEAETQKTLAEIQLDKDKLAFEKLKFNAQQQELPKATVDKVDKSVEAAGTASETALAASELLDQMGYTKNSFGEFKKTKKGVERGEGFWEGTLGSRLKEWTGQGGEEMSFRTALNGLINKVIIDQRKPGMGPMSDKDFDVLRGAAPSVDAPEEQIVTYLNALNRYQTFKKNQEELRSKFITQNKFEGAARESFEINGYQVEKGENFNDFVRKVGPQIYEDEGFRAKNQRSGESSAPSFDPETSNVTPNSLRMEFIQ